MIESKNLRKNIQLELHGQRLEIITVTPPIWNGLRTDILKIEYESFPSSLADSEKDLYKLVDSPTGIFLVLSVPPSSGLIGYIAADILDNFPDIPGVAADRHFGKRDTMYLESVVVLPDRRGHGFGTILMRECLQEASRRGIQRATAHVETGSATRIGLDARVVRSFENWYGTDRSFDYVEFHSFLEGGSRAALEDWITGDGFR